MNSEKEQENILILKYIGEDSWSRPVYQDQFQHLWKDIELGKFADPSLYAAVNDDFEGEPDTSIKKKYTILPREGIISEEKRFQYMMLGRLQNDCDYYLGYGKSLLATRSAEEKQAHIESMKDLWNSFSVEEKPVWLTWEQILEYEEKMCKEQEEIHE